MSAPKTDNCPFCGGDKHMVLPPNCTKTGDYNPGDNAQPIVRCMTCYAEAMGSPWDYTKESAVAAWNRRTDLSQASVAAALEAAAMKNDNFAAHLQAEAFMFLLRDVSEATRLASEVAKLFKVEANAIRALITDRDRDALAAHVAAEVAKARAEDAALLYNAWLGLRVLGNIAKVKGLSGAADVTTPLLAEIEAAHPEFAPRSALCTRIGANA